MKTLNAGGTVTKQTNALKFTSVAGDDQTMPSLNIQDIALNLGWETGEDPAFGPAGFGLVGPARTGGLNTPSAGTFETVTAAGGGLVFNNTFTSNCTQAYASCVGAAEQAYQGLWDNSLSVNMTFDEQAQGTTNVLASNRWNTFSVSFAQLRNALSASVFLPSVDPTGGHTWTLPQAYARMLGLSSSTPTTDDTVTLNSSYGWSFGQDVTSAVEHEISEGVMGRVGGLGDQNSGWSTMDLFRYSAPGVRDLTDGRDGTTTYFSVDGNTLSSLAFNNEYAGSNFHGGDTADFTQLDVYGTGNPGLAMTLSQTDIAIMAALGWKWGAAPEVHANDLGYAPSASGANSFIDLTNFEASFPDLINALGSNSQAMAAWYNAREPVEHRTGTFNGLDYIASYSDLRQAFVTPGASPTVIQDEGASHYIAHGLAEGRTTTFDALDYIASYNDLSRVLSDNADAGAMHFLAHGAAEGRTTTFDGLDYIASYKDLAAAFGVNEQAGANHFIKHGNLEGRVTTFDGLAYVANYTDLMKALGADNDVGATHFIAHGASEGRNTSFDVQAYEAAHTDLQGTYATNDQFLTQYINHYVQTGLELT